jgi:hypothetical protein
MENNPVKKHHTLQAALCAPVPHKARTHCTNSALAPSTSSPAPETPIGAIRKRDFLKKYNITRWTFRNLSKRGEAPRTFFICSMEYVSHEAEAAWIRAREAAHAAEPRSHRIVK